MSENKLKFDARIKNPDDQIVATLHRIDEANGIINLSLRLTPHVLERLRRSAFIASAGASTRLAGSALSDGDVEKIMGVTEQIDDTLSPKQREVWEYIRRNGEANLSEIVGHTGIVRATVRQALLRLLEIEKIKRVGRGRATRYVALV